MKSAQPIPKYKHIGKRIENAACGKCGRIARAERRKDVKRGWNIWITWDDGHISSCWTDRDIGPRAINRIVLDDYAPDHGPITGRIEALLARMAIGGIEWRRGYISSVYVGRDNIGIWRPSGTFVASAHLWAGQGDWEGEGNTASEAWAALRKQLEGAIRNENVPDQATASK